MNPNKREEISLMIKEQVQETFKDFGKDIAEFEKVSIDQFVEDSIKHGWSEEAAIEAYKNIVMPQASTEESAGFDFNTPYGIELEIGQSVLIPSGIRCKMDKKWALILLPRSGQGTKFRIQLDNTIGLIDKDYYFANNEGHIMMKITNDGQEGKVFELAAHEKFMQGMFLYTGTAKNATSSNKRTGGFGSTGNSK